ncbi:MAG: hypothetical protein ACLVJH_09300 [Faecalibacterium prausnitzii]
MAISDSGARRQQLYGTVELLEPAERARIKGQVPQQVPGAMPPS